MKDERPWRLQGLKHIVLGNPVKADTSKQHFSVIPLTKYYDIQIRCQKCKKWFIFSAKEQKHWYEELKFWVDSVPKSCHDCNYKKRVYDDIIGGLGKLISNDSSLESNKQEVEYLVQEIISRKLRLSNTFYSKILECLKELNIEEYEEIKQKLKQQLS